MEKQGTQSKVMRFDEDSFDLSSHKKAADAVIREKVRKKRIRRQVTVGKAVMAIVAFLIFMLLFFVAVTTGLVAI
ncbi:MAG: hypothetical protein FWE05_01610 [Defluviitaleaceae bacterium]|nr:hypothetical protein [Defluviitaleaceae bacterium]